MSLLDTLHRWTGGLIGLVLALLGLTGAILVHRDAWIDLPHASDARVADGAALAAATARLMADPAARPQSILYASDGFGLLRLSYAKGAGAYADQAGDIVSRWDSQWERPELWLFDLHHHLFAGDAGEVVIGIAALCGLFFVISGVVLWWRTRRTFEWRLWPRRMSRPAIVRHHRDLGIVMAPLLALSLYTGAVMIFRPVAVVALGPGTSAAVERAMKPPKPIGVPLSDAIDWAAIIRAAHARFPDAELRLLSLPRKDSGLIAVRMRQPEEWLPNGRTMLWFAADSGRLVAARDARGFDRQARGYNMIYPIHAAKVGGLGWRIVITLSGLALALLGSLAVWSFWFRRPKRRL
ncbi:PepSY domain-containing protein [Rhizorhabdus wittichii]|uniref:PepSY domain-containing protein n=1 Tax=Rhizorhabdus wittichii TaxID=160791 RepID=A0A975D7N7_9SPHN|nr:PepSY-associated TM helix domain-containing protein [Rhizorhabdus wittichii]QTH24560.1 PepSY domain-containing protein [Rhizorhabdus wittichii]